MAIKTFSVGEVLTASDTNTYLANSGLVYITSATIGSGVTFATVANCFSSTYDNYKIVINGGTGSTTDTLHLTLGATTTGYYAGVARVTYDTAAAANLNDNNAAAWRYFGVIGTACITMDVDLFDPNATKPTRIHGWWIDPRVTAGIAAGAGGGVLNDTTAYTGFTVTRGTAGTTMTGGTITVYGYRKA